MRTEETVCPRCGGTEFDELDCGPDGYDDDISYMSLKCTGCGLWWDGWVDKWLVDVDTWQESEGACEYAPSSEVVATEKLLPCPFCGEKDDIKVQCRTYDGGAIGIFGRIYWSVECYGCEARTGDCFDNDAIAEGFQSGKEKAVMAWNTRTKSE